MAVSLGIPSYWSGWNPPFASGEGVTSCVGYRPHRRAEDHHHGHTRPFAEALPRIGAGAQPRLRGWRISPSYGSPRPGSPSFYELGQRADLSGFYLGVILRSIGIAYLTALGAQVSKDAGEEAVALVIEIAGKIMILLISIPVVVAILDTLVGLLP